MRMFTILLCSTIGLAFAQINLGSFFLHPQPAGGFDLGMGQGANILGFGGDRSLNIAGNRGGFAMGSNNGALIGGQRVGVDGGIGAGREGLEMGSQMQFGNNPNPMHPAGQLGDFLENVKNFFSFLGRGMLMPPQPPPSPPFMIGPIGVTQSPRLIESEEAEEKHHKPKPWFPDEDVEEAEAEVMVNTDKNEEENWSSAIKEGEVTTMTTMTTSSSEVEEISPNNGDKKETIFLNKKQQPNIDFNGDEEVDTFSENIFTAHTSRPRQLPGLIEFA